MSDGRSHEGHTTYYVHTFSANVKYLHQVRNEAEIKASSWTGKTTQEQFSLGKPMSILMIDPSGSKDLSE